MAWISVHEDVIGGKLRELSKAIGCSQNEAVGILIRLWLWCINNADKYGYIIGADKNDVAEILSVGRERSLDPDQIVEALISCNWIDCEEDSLFIHDWEEWQEPLYTFKERREKDRERKRRSEKCQEVQKEPEKPEEPTSTPELPDKEEKPEKPPKQKGDYSTDFVSFWEVYPRKADKGTAYAKYRARLKDGFSPETLIQAAKNYRDRCERERTPEKYILHGKTFLSDKTPFLDYLPAGGAQEEPAGRYTDDGTNPWN